MPWGRPVSSVEWTSTASGKDSSPTTSINSSISSSSRHDHDESPSAIMVGWGDLSDDSSSGSFFEQPVDDASTSWWGGTDHLGVDGEGSEPGSAPMPPQAAHYQQRAPPVSSVWSGGAVQVKAAPVGPPVHGPSSGQPPSVALPGGGRNRGTAEQGGGAVDGSAATPPQPNSGGSVEPQLMGDPPAAMGGSSGAGRSRAADRPKRQRTAATVKRPNVGAKEFPWRQALQILVSAPHPNLSARRRAVFAL
eukprot:COSAG01_NODE_5223_length_4402_cov_3.387869_1_plen_249_part_00